MIHWIVAKAILGLKTGLMAGLSLLSSADWSSGSSSLVRTFLAEGGVPRVGVVMAADPDVIEPAGQYIVRRVEVRRAMEKAIEADRIVRVVCLRNGTVAETEDIVGGCHGDEI